MIHLEEADRDESAPVTYFPGQPADHLAAYPLPHLIDAFVRYGYRIGGSHLERCRIMLRAGLVPDSIGKPGSPPIGVRIDYELARGILKKLERA
jgi:hypothetical protein